MITRTTNDVVQVQMTFMQLLRMLLQSPIMLVAGTVLAYIQQPRLAKLYMLFIVIPRASVSAKRINEVLDAENQLQAPVKSVSMPKGPAELEFDQVSFRYAGAEEAALEGINFKVNAGQTLALIGGNGSGQASPPWST
ncbi:ABC transporter ATP-binding protein [Lactobacillus delbrueckii]|uniref:ABC transporter ATP-binding protein n=2 Tax=Lactobacillus delbrueckii TaxID=1584 RepID=UPI0037CBD5C3